MDNNDVFISYKSEEFEEAEWVRATLESNGVSCWMAPACIPGGSSYAVEIPQAIRNCKVFVLILSEKSQLSKWVPRELDQAINMGKTVLPFMLENCSLKDDFNFYLTNVQRYAAYESKTAAFEKMLREIRAILNADKDDSDASLSNTDRKTLINETKGFSSESVGTEAKSAKKEKKVRSRRKKKSESKNDKKKLRVTVGVAASLVITVLVAVIINAVNTVVIAGEKYKKDDSSIYLSDCNLTYEDIEAIREMKELFSLSFENCSLPDTDISWVITATGKLTLKKCGITDEHISTIDFSNSEISEIIIDGNPLLTDLSALTDISDTLTSLSFSGCNVSDISFVNSLHKLRYFYADRNGISDISALSNCPELKSLYLSENSISSLEPLSDCTNLTDIRVNSNNLTSLKGLEKAISLKTVEGSDNPISELDGIANTTVLERVALNDICLNSYSFASSLIILANSAATLEELYLDNSNITVCSFLSSCTNLRKLSLNNNLFMSSLEFLENCTELEYLSAYGCGISSLKGIENCNALTYVDLSDNIINSAEFIPAFSADSNYNGVHLDLSGNNLTSIKLPDTDYRYLALYGNVLSSQNIPDTSGEKIVFDYSESFDYSAIKNANYSNYVIIDCPLNKQLSVSEMLGDYYVKFMSEHEYEESLIAS